MGCARWEGSTNERKTVDQDRAFEEYWKANKARLLCDESLRGRTASVKAIAREVWYGALNANEPAEEMAQLKWFRDVCAEEAGVDAPGCEGAHPLRDWLKELKAARADGTPRDEEYLLATLAAHASGPAAALGQAGLLALRKTADYDDGESRDDYFPLGLASYAQMLHVKVRRLLLAARRPRELNFESARDTCLDMVNYASFAADWLARQKPGEEGR